MLGLREVKVVMRRSDGITVTKRMITIRSKQGVLKQLQRQMTPANRAMLSSNGRLEFFTGNMIPAIIQIY